MRLAMVPWVMAFVRDLWLAAVDTRRPLSRSIRIQLCSSRGLGLVQKSVYKGSIQQNTNHLHTFIRHCTHDLHFFVCDGYTWDLGSLYAGFRAGPAICIQGVYTRGSGLLQQSAYRGSITGLGAAPAICIQNGLYAGFRAGPEICIQGVYQANTGGGPRVVVSAAAFHARVPGSVPGLGGLKETKMFLPHPRVKVSIVGSLRDWEVAGSASDHQGSNFESCVWRSVSSQSSHHPQEVLLAQFSLYVHKGFHFIYQANTKHVLYTCFVYAVYTWDLGLIQQSVYRGSIRGI